MGGFLIYRTGIDLFDQERLAIDELVTSLI